MKTQKSQLSTRLMYQIIFHHLNQNRDTHQIIQIIPHQMQQLINIINSRFIKKLLMEEMILEEKHSLELITRIKINSYH